MSMRKDNGPRKMREVEILKTGLLPWKSFQPWNSSTELWQTLKTPLVEKKRCVTVKMSVCAVLREVCWRQTVEESYKTSQSRKPKRN